MNKQTSHKISSEQESSRLTRRDFLHATATASVAGGLFAAMSTNAKGQTMTDTTTTNETSTMKPQSKPIYKTLKFGMIREKVSILDKFKLIKDLGYDAVELDSPGGQDKKKCRAASEKTDLIIDGIVDSRHWKIRATAADAKMRQQCTKDLITAIEEAHYCGASTVLFVPGHGKDGPDDVILPRAVQVIQQALPTASKYGVSIVIENVWNHMFYDHGKPPEQSAKRLANFVDRFNSPLVGVQFDIGNHHKYGQPEQWIKTLGPRVYKLDAKGWSREKNGWADIGEGTINWPAVRKALDEINFTGYVAAEVGGGDRKRLAKVLDQMNQTLPNE